MPLHKALGANTFKIKGKKRAEDFDGTSGFFVSSHYERHYVTQKYGENSQALRFLDFIHGHPFQFFLGLLLVLDVCVIITELVLEAHMPECHVIEHHCSCECEDHSHAMCLDGHEVEPHCHAHPQWVDDLHKSLLGISIGILSIFEIELFAIFAVVRSLFFHNFWYMLDVIIVTVSLVIEVLILKHILVYEESEIGLLVFIRLWRFVRIGHGIYVDTHEFEHAKTEALEIKLKELQATLEGQEKPSGVQLVSAASSSPERLL